MEIEGHLQYPTTQMGLQTYHASRINGITLAGFRITPRVGKENG
uniref:Uncharacterized protein n=1 Tax=Rhizophora mucronata TaxID=61149 RepID=A0A2P2P1T8_RHIMU